MIESQDGNYTKRRISLSDKYKSTKTMLPDGTLVGIGGVDHLALICSDMDCTIQFYTEVVGMRVDKIVPNRDEPSSTHVFLDMGGGNSLAFFDFPNHGTTRTKRGVGSMHHLALKCTPEQYSKIVMKLRQRGIKHDIHGDDNLGSVYFRDPDDILLEVTTGN